MTVAPLYDSSPPPSSDAAAAPVIAWAHAPAPACALTAATLRTILVDGVHRVFVDHAAFRELRGDGIYGGANSTYAEPSGVDGATPWPHLDVRYSILCQAALAAPLLVWGAGGWGEGGEVAARAAARGAAEAMLRVAGAVEEEDAEKPLEGQWHVVDDGDGGGGVVVATGSAARAGLLAAAATPPPPPVDTSVAAEPTAEPAAEPAAMLDQPRPSTGGGDGDTPLPELQRPRPPPRAARRKADAGKADEKVVSEASAAPGGVVVRDDAPAESASVDEDAPAATDAAPAAPAAAGDAPAAPAAVSDAPATSLAAVGAAPAAPASVGAASAAQTAAGDALAAAPAAAGATAAAPTAAAAPPHFTVAAWQTSCGPRVDAQAECWCCSRGRGGRAGSSG